VPDIEVSKAKLSDRRHFMKLWKALLEEDLALGGDILPSEANLKQMMGLFTAYVNNMIPGVATVAKDGDTIVGVTMCGQSPPQTFWLESPRGESATVWGDYVLPEYRRRGISQKMLSYTREVMVKEMCISYAYSTINRNEAAEKNAERFGAEYISRTIIYKVDHEPQK
jgi:GNAT superfamily N-acetyltransferase